MKSIASITVFLILAAIAAAGPYVEIAIRYEGFDPSSYAEVADLKKGEEAPDHLSSPTITNKPGAHAISEIIHEVQVPGADDDEKVVPAGATLWVVSAAENNGRITVSGKSVLRRRLSQEGDQPLGALSFATRETFFSGTVEDGKELTIAVGDGPKEGSHHPDRPAGGPSGCSRPMNATNEVQQRTDAELGFVRRCYPSPIKK